MKKLVPALVMLVILALSLSSCGASGPATKLKITMTDFKYDPNANTVAGGKEITLSLKNEGAVLHEYVIMKHGLSAGDDFGPEDEENIYWEVEVDPGTSKTVTFTAPSDLGDYEIVCGTEGHLVAGMKGTLTVVAP